MIIRNLNNPERGNSSATITLNYDEIRCLCNSLYTLAEECDDKDLQRNFNQVYADIIQLFALVKHGRLLDDQIESIYELLNLDKDNMSKIFTEVSGNEEEVKS